jgi:hypothetical protein
VKSIEAREYQQLINQLLMNMGITPINNTTKTNCKIMVNYGISTHKHQEIQQPIYGSTGIDSTISYSKVIPKTNTIVTKTTNNPSYGIIGYKKKNILYQDRTLTLQAINTDNREELWNVHISSWGIKPGLRRIFPLLICAASHYGRQDHKDLIWLGFTETEAEQINEGNCSFLNWKSIKNSLVKFVDNEEIYY